MESIFDIDMPLLPTNEDMEEVEDESESNGENVQVGENENLQSSSTTKSCKKKKRKLTSKVWNYFDIIPLSEDGKERSKCKRCGQTYLCDSRYGTGNMKKHIEKCPRIDTKDIGQYILERSIAGNLLAKSRRFDQTKFRELLINAVIKHDLPLSFVDYEGVRAVFSYLEPNVTHISRNTCKLDIKRVHADFISKINLQLKQCPGRICLTSDCWTSIATDGYMSLTAHYLDKNWVLHKRILNFSYMPPPHSGVALAEKIYNLISGWGIEKKLFSITLDNASANNSCVEILKSQLNLQRCLVDFGSLFHVKCCAHILNLIVKEGLKEIDESVDKVRECVKYVKGSPSRKQKFLECVVHNFLESKRSLKQDVPTRWNSTYLMLNSALYYKLAFCHLELSDSNFKHNPSKDEWDKVEKICSFLELFYEATNAFSGVRYPTANLYFPNVFMIQLKLTEGMESSDSYIKKLAIDMHLKFEKYWNEYSPLLAIAVVFDPRYKMQFVEFCYKKLYGSGGALECAKLRSRLSSMFEAYKSNISTSGESSSCSRYQGQPRTVSTMVVEEIGTQKSSVFQEFDEFENEETLQHLQKTELELYLDEPRVERTAKLDILVHWKAHQYRYPMLAQMVRDVLTVPVSTVASESAFSNGSRVLDKFRSSLSHDIVESLICVKDWLYGEALAENLNLDEFIEDIMSLGINDKETPLDGSNV